MGATHSSTVAKTPSYQVRTLTCEGGAPEPTPAKRLRREEPLLLPASLATHSKDDGRFTGQQVADLVLALRQTVMTPPPPSPAGRTPRGRTNHESRTQWRRNRIHADPYLPAIWNTFQFVACFNLLHHMYLSPRETSNFWYNNI